VVKANQPDAVAIFRGRRWALGPVGTVDFIKKKLREGFHVQAVGREGFTLVADLRGLPPMRRA
jgi:hypothetical protein